MENEQFDIVIIRNSDCNRVNSENDQDFLNDEDFTSGSCCFSLGLCCKSSGS